MAAIAATLEHSPGTVVEVAVTYLTPELLKRMDDTEGAYDFVRLTGITLEIGSTPLVHQYATIWAGLLVGVIELKLVSFPQRLHWLEAGKLT